MGFEPCLFATSSLIICPARIWNSWLCFLRPLSVWANRGPERLKLNFFATRERHVLSPTEPSYSIDMLDLLIGRVETNSQ
jgi:hypothetical protein